MFNHMPFLLFFQLDLSAVFTLIPSWLTRHTKYLPITDQTLSQFPFECLWAAEEIFCLIYLLIGVLSKGDTADGRGRLALC